MSPIGEYGGTQGNNKICLCVFILSVMRRIITYMMQELSGGMWLQFAMGHLIQSRLLEKYLFDPDPDEGVQASWQGPFFQK